VSGSGGRRQGLIALGVGIAAAGAGAALGLAAERLAAGRVLGEQLPPTERGELPDPRGGPPLGSLHGQAHIVVADDGVPLHVEVDEAELDDERPGGRRGSRRDRDEGPPLTFLLTHGYALTLDSWHYQRLALRRHGRVVLWDQRGHGRSGTGPAGSSTIDQVGRDLAAVVDAVAPEGPLVLVGHSMGGMTVMSLAHLRPELFAERVAGVAFLATSAGGLGDLDLGLKGVGRLAVRAAPMAARVVARSPGLAAQGRRVSSDLETLLVRRYSFASEVAPALVRFSAGMIAATRLEVISDFLPTFAGHDKREALAAMSGAEVLVMVGDSDLLIPAGHSEEIARLLPDAEHVVVHPAGHLLMLEHPDVVDRHLLGLAERSRDAAEGRTGTRRTGWGRRTVTPVRQHRRGRARPSGKGS
jgi:pimeloyl-ACP methyl ester carboxylesterase